MPDILTHSWTLDVIYNVLTGILVIIGRSRRSHRRYCPSSCDPSRIRPQTLLGRFSLLVLRPNNNFAGSDNLSAIFGTLAE